MWSRCLIEFIVWFWNCFIVIRMVILFTIGENSMFVLCLRQKFSSKAVRWIEQSILRDWTSLLFDAPIGDFCWQYEYFTIEWGLFGGWSNGLVAKTRFCDCNIVSLKKKRFCEKDKNIIDFYIQQ